MYPWEKISYFTFQEVLDLFSSLRPASPHDKTFADDWFSKILDASDLELAIYGISEFISNEELELDVEAVILYAQKNHKSVFSSIEAKIDEIVDLEMKKRVSLKSQSQPWLFVFDPEDFNQVKVLQQQIEEDEPYCFVPVKQVDKAKALTSGAPYIVDKIQAQIDGRVDEVLTMLGVNNLGVDEKKEHLVVDEINANNEDIEQQSYSFKSEIEDGFERVNKVLGYKVQVVDLNDMFKEAEDEVNEKGEDDEDVSMGED